MVYESFNWNHGVFIGSAISSESTAASTGKVGVLSHNPMAMMPFCGYNMGDYFKQWIKMGELLGDKAPKIFGVNWFRVDDDGKFIWPGFGDNIRVLEWILKRCDNKIDAKNTAIGYMPFENDINLEESGVSKETLKKLLNIDKNLWMKELNSIKEFYKIFGDNLSKDLKNELNKLKSRLENM